MRTNRVILHIGIHKTGSKSIQLWLDALSESDPSGVASPRVLSGEMWMKALFLDLLAGRREQLEMLRSRVESVNSDVSIISYEGLFELPDVESHRLLNVLRPANTVLFVRDQVGYLNSMLNQVVKAHRTAIMEIEAFRASILEPNSNLDYPSLRHRWRSLGAQNLTILKWDYSIDSVRSFAEAMQLPTPARIDSDRIVSVNPPLDVFGLAVMYEVKRRVADHSRLPAVVSIAHELLTHNFFEVSRENVAPRLIDDASVWRIQENYDQSNRRLDQEEEIKLEFEPILLRPYVDIEALSRDDMCIRVADEIISRASSIE